MSAIKDLFNLIRRTLAIHIEVGKSLARAKTNSLILFPYHPLVFSCGISAFVAFKGEKKEINFDLAQFSKEISKLQKKILLPTGTNPETDSPAIINEYLGGDRLLERLFKTAQTLKLESVFSTLFFRDDKITQLTETVDLIRQTIADQEKGFKRTGPRLASSDVEIISMRIEKLKDIFWCLKKEVLDNIAAVKKLSRGITPDANPEGLIIFKRINSVLNSIDRLEVRGRDSAGISVVLTLTKAEFENFRTGLVQTGLSESLKTRTNHLVLANNSISINDTVEETSGDHLVSISFA
jgi:glucosamine--fructose-6-phosphate aminotransferase (isomerizing)